MPRSDIRTFSEQAVAVAFPLGGIGTGNVSLGARGELRDWEIFNQPNKGAMLPNTFFALRTQIEGDAPVTKVLEGPIQPPHTLSHGYHPATGAGLPRLRGTTFRGEYPFATIDFDDPDLPVRVSLEAWTPLVPLDPEAVRYPLRDLLVHPHKYQRPSSRADPGRIAGESRGRYQARSVRQYWGGRRGGTRNDVRDEAGVRGLFLHSEHFKPR